MPQMHEKDAQPSKKKGLSLDSNSKNSIQVLMWFKKVFPNKGASLVGYKFQSDGVAQEIYE